MCVIVCCLKSVARCLLSQWQGPDSYGQLWNKMTSKRVLQTFTMSISGQERVCTGQRELREDPVRNACIQSHSIQDCIKHHTTAAAGTLKLVIDKNQVKVGF